MQEPGPSTATPQSGPAAQEAALDTIADMSLLEEEQTGATPADPQDMDTLQRLLDGVDISEDPEVAELLLTQQKAMEALEAAKLQAKEAEAAIHARRLANERAKLAAEAQRAREELERQAAAAAAAASAPRITPEREAALRETLQALSAPPLQRKPGDVWAQRTDVYEHPWIAQRRTALLKECAATVAAFRQQHGDTAEPPVKDASDPVWRAMQLQYILEFGGPHLHELITFLENEPRPTTRAQTAVLSCSVGSLQVGLDYATGLLGQRAQKVSEVAMGYSELRSLNLELRVLLDREKRDNMKLEEQFRERGRRLAAMDAHLHAQRTQIENLTKALAEWTSKIPSKGDKPITQQPPKFDTKNAATLPTWERKVLDAVSRLMIPAHQQVPFAINGFPDTMLPLLWQWRENEATEKYGGDVTSVTLQDFFSYLRARYVSRKEMEQLAAKIKLGEYQQSPSETVQEYFLRLDTDAAMLRMCDLPENKVPTTENLVDCVLNGLRDNNLRLQLFYRPDNPTEKQTDYKALCKRAIQLLTHNESGYPDANPRRGTAGGAGAKQAGSGGAGPSGTAGGPAGRSPMGKRKGAPGSSGHGGAPPKQPKTGEIPPRPTGPRCGHCHWASHTEENCGYKKRGMDKKQMDAIRAAADKALLNDTNWAAFYRENASRKAKKRRESRKSNQKYPGKKPVN